MSKRNTRIYIWVIEDDKLKLNLRELFKYPELAAIYDRDKSPQKIYAHQVYRYIDHIANRDGYCVINGLGPKASHNFAVKHSNLGEDFKPDKTIKLAIALAKELNGGVIEDSIDNTVKALRINSDLLIKIADSFEELKDNTKGVEDIKSIISLTDTLIGMSNVIPKQIDKLLDLKKTYDQEQNGIKLGRGGVELSNSHDGEGFERLSDTGQVERLD